MKKARNQIQIGREPLSHYVIRSEIYLSWLFAFFGICSTGLLIYSTAATAITTFNTIIPIKTRFGTLEVRCKN